MIQASRVINRIGVIGAKASVRTIRIVTLPMVVIVLVRRIVGVGGCTRGGSSKSHIAGVGSRRAGSQSKSSVAGGRFVIVRDSDHGRRSCGGSPCARAGIVADRRRGCFKTARSVIGIWLAHGHLDKILRNCLSQRINGGGRVGTNGSHLQFRRRGSIGDIVIIHVVTFGITRHVHRGFIVIRSNISNGVLVRCIEFLVEGLGITSDVNTASFARAIKGWAIFDSLAEHVESITLKENVDEHMTMLFLFCKHNQLSLKLGGSKRPICARNVEHDERRHGEVILLHQQAKDSVGKIVVNIMATKVILKMVEGVMEKDRKPIILALHSMIVVAFFFAFGLLSCSQMMKRNGDVLEVLILIGIIEEIRNIDANKDMLARQSRNERVDQSWAHRVKDNRSHDDRIPMQQPTTNEIESVEG